MKIDWGYVAGFFDGEGCVSQQDTFSSAVWIGQKYRPVLDEIKQFLDKEEIVCKVYPSVRKQQLFLLRISAKRENIKKFFKRVLPYTITKRTAVQDALRHMALFPLRNTPEYRANI
jgi:intein-encoded DNA endonuclease-like protein